MESFAIIDKLYDQIKLQINLKSLKQLLVMHFCKKKNKNIIYKNKNKNLPHSNLKKNKKSIKQRKNYNIIIIVILNKKIVLD